MQEKKNRQIITFIAFIAMLPVFTATNLTLIVIAVLFVLIGVSIYLPGSAEFKTHSTGESK